MAIDCNTYCDTVVMYVLQYIAIRFCRIVTPLCLPIALKWLKDLTLDFINPFDDEQMHLKC